MISSELLDEFVCRVNDGRMTFADVRKELTSRGVDELVISKVMRLVDNDVQKIVVSRAKKARYKQLVTAGMVLMGIGVLMSIASLAGLFSSGKPIVLVFTFGPLLGGPALAFAGLRQKTGHQRGQFASRFRSRH